MKNRTNKKCPICNNEMEYAFSAKQLDSSTKTDFPIIKCSNCGHAITLIDNYDLQKVYEQGNYNEKEKNWHKIARPILNIIEQNKFRYIKSNAHIKGNLLEIGCGKGKLLEIAQNNGYNILGLEPSRRSFTFADKRLHGKILSKTIVQAYNDTDLDNNYDYIILWHVLEHIENLDDTVQILKNILTDSGKIIIAVPNFNSFQSKYGKADWFHLDPPRHLHHFNSKSINMLFEKYDLKVEKISYNSFYQNYIGELFTLMNKLLVKKNVLLNISKSNYSNYGNKLIALYYAIISLIIGLIIFVPTIFLTIILSIINRSGTIVIKVINK